MTPLSELPKEADWRSEHIPLDTRVDNAVRDLKRTGDIDTFIDDMERNISIAKVLMKQNQLTPYAVAQYINWYDNYLVAYINTQGDTEAIHIPIQDGNVRRADEIDLAEGYDKS